MQSRPASRPTHTFALRRPVELLATALRSPAVRSASILAAGGVGFALGNLLLARILPAADYGAVSLLLSLIQVGAALGTLGLPTLVNRHRLRATAQLLRYASALGALAMVVTVLLASYFYDLTPAVLAVLTATTVMAALGRVAGAVLQSEERFGTSMVLTQIHNWLLLASVPVVLMQEQRSAIAVALVILCSYVLSSIAGWSLARQASERDGGALSLSLLRSEGLSAAGFGLAINIFFQLDRLVIGRLLSLEDLAVYAVVAAIAGSAFRMLQVGAGYTLTPRLRAVTARAPALTLLRHEALIVFGLGLLATPLLLALTPWLVDRFLARHLDSSLGLVIAVIAVGFVRLWEGFSAAVVNAIGSPRELSLLSYLAWSALAISLAAAAWGSRHGLIGAVYGLGAGWSVVAIGATVLAHRALQRLQR